MTIDKDEQQTVKNNDTAFSDPIPADLPRRQFDRKLLESYDSDHERIRAVSSRLTRIEVVSESVQRDLSRIDQKQSEILNHYEQIASSMAAIANKLNIHTEMEEYQWTVVNNSHNSLATLTGSLNEHLQKAAAIDTRINWIERLTLLLYGGIGSLAMLFITQYLIH